MAAWGRLPIQPQEEFFMMRIAKKVLRRLGSHNAIYDEEYYERDVEGPANQSAPHIARSIVERFSPRSLVDVGCGTGAMMEAFKRLGVSVLGLEYSKAGIERCKKRELEVIKFNIERDAAPERFSFDIALSMEVAEHLPASVAPKYVLLLCRLAPIVICSAARPGQGGVDHVNLQPKEYWIELFADNHRAIDQASTDALAMYWQQKGVAGFYYENLMVFGATR
jgi:SAM-dependent methyltransferase